MNKKEFRELVSKRRLFLDGATGSNLIKRGNMPSGVCPEKWILDNPEILIGLQYDYLKAGTNIVYAPTFTANSIKLEEYGLADKVDSINAELVALSKEAVRRAEADGIEGPHFVAGDLTMTGKQLYPMGSLTVEELILVYKQQIKALLAAEVDLLVVETMMSLQECRCALIAAKEVCDLPVMITMTFEESGRALYGTDPLTALVTLQALGADAFGINCGAGPDTVSDFIKELIEVSNIPIICKPNAGLPSLLPDGSTGYSMDCDQFARAMEPILEVYTPIIGGCCGTAPEYIEALVQKSSVYNYKPVFLKDSDENEGNSARLYTNDSPSYYLTSERKTIHFDLNSPFIIVGERINPTGKKDLQQQLRDGNFEMVREFAQQQEEHGAEILDVNMGMSGIDEKEVMLKAIDEVCQISNLPVSIDSSDPVVMEAALRHYPGRALVNSVSLEQVKIDEMLPLVKKYGAMMILLPLSDDGLPGSLEEKKSIIDKVLNKAYEIGLTNSDIIVDGLVATVGANPNAAIETLETIKHCKDNLKLATTCGLSNISFGLPERSFVNSAFLTMAIMSGLTMAISNPNQDLLANTAFASDLLRNKSGADIKYIEQISSRTEELEEEGAFISLYGGKKIIPGTTDESNVSGSSKKSGVSGENDNNLSSKEQQLIHKAVMKGNRDRITQLTIEAVEAGIDPHLILNETLLPAINLVGEYFDKGKYFLPQLIASAETMEKSIQYLEPLLKQSGDKAQEKGRVIVATVKGDIHDIGKNLVTLMLKNHGFEVHDLGKDVPREEIVEAAINEQADIIALSALMTTTMKEMDEVIKYAREKGCKAKFMIGGAVITEDYAVEIGADGYSTDAADAVKLAGRLMDNLKENN